MQIEEFLRDDPRFRREPGQGMPADLLSPWATSLCFPSTIKPTARSRRRREA
jgi:hypothetical protein